MTQLLGNWLALGLWSPGALSLERSGDWVRIMQGGDLPDVVLFSAEGNFQTPCPMAGAVSHLRQSQPLLQGKEAIAQTGTGPGPASFPRRQAPCWADPPPHTHTLPEHHQAHLSVPTHLPTNPAGTQSMAKAELGVGHIGGVQSRPESCLCGLEGGDLASWSLLSQWGKVPLQVSCRGELPHSALYTGPSNCHTPKSQWLLRMRSHPAGLGLVPSSRPQGGRCR